MITASVLIDVKSKDDEQLKAIDLEDEDVAGLLNDAEKNLDNEDQDDSDFDVEAYLKFR